MPAGIGTLAAIVIDVADIDRAGAFWSAVLGVELGERIGQYQVIGPPIPAPAFLLQEVPEPKAGKNRVHIDISCEDLEAGVRRVEEMGGRKLRDGYDFGHSFMVVADTEGNEFCLLPAAT